MYNPSNLQCFTSVGYMSIIITHNNNHGIKMLLLNCRKLSFMFNIMLYSQQIGVTYLRLRWVVIITIFIVVIAVEEYISYSLSRHKDQLCA